AGGGRPAAPAAGGLSAGGRLPVRLLHAGHAHVRPGALDAAAPPEPARHPRLHGGQRLPLRHLPADRGGHPRGGPRAARGCAMAADPLLDALPEPERYELWDALDDLLEPSRRAFFRIVGGGLVVALVLGDAALREASAQVQRRQPGRLPRELGAWLHIGQDGAVTVYTGKTEVGQNI